MNSHTKHEVIHCERCRAQFECKANSFTKCQCSKVPLTLNETQYVSENYDGCLCADCLVSVKEEYKAQFTEKNIDVRKLAQEISQGIKPGIKPNLDEVVAEVNAYRTENT